MIRILAMSAMTLLSLFCLVAVPGVFVQALLIVFILYAVCGVVAYLGYLKFSAANLFILSLALSLSPATDMYLIYKHYILASASLASATIGFGGLIIGINKLQGKNA